MNKRLTSYIGCNTTTKDKNRNCIKFDMSSKNTTKIHEKVALVTGSSSEIGFETSIALAKNGFHTYATMRDLDNSNKIKEIANKERLSLDVLRLDVTDDNSIKETIGQIFDKSNRIDVLINNAGYALAGPLEETSTKEIKAQFETNFLERLKLCNQ
jgi:NADP-dependent 3-hydroxy acid dehydrogenase YdfG